MPNDGPIPIDLDAVESVVASYVTMRYAMVSSLKRDKAGHTAFIQFCNDQSCLLNATLGNLDGTQLAALVKVAQRGVIPLDSTVLDEGFIELLKCQIAYLDIMALRAAEKTENAAIRRANNGNASRRINNNGKIDGR